MKSVLAGQRIRNALREFQGRSSYQDVERIPVLGVESVNEIYEVVWREVDLEFLEEHIGQSVYCGRYHEILQQHLQEHYPPEESLNELKQLRFDTESTASQPANFLDRSAHIETTGLKCLTGIEPLDECLEGGLGAELGIIQGAIGAGKSMFLNDVATFNAFTKGKFVLYITLELSVAKVLQRVDSYMFDCPLSGVSAVLADEKRWKKKMEEVSDSGGELRVIYLPPGATGVDDFESALEKVQIQAERKLDMVVLDYMTLLSEPHLRGQSGGRYSELGTIATGIRRSALTRQIPIWSACQSRRGSSEQQIVGLDATADSLEIPRIADTVVIICQTISEQRKDTLRLLIAKHRAGGGRGKEVSCITAFERAKLALSAETLDTF